MAVEVDTPCESQGDLMGDLNRRRGDIVSMESNQTNVLLKARVPLSELWGYANAIRSLSRGRASYSMTPSHFEPVPDALTTKVISESK
jgi:elongation factor G